MSIPHKNLTPAKRGTRGFTMIEIMIVSTIMGMIVAIAAPGWLRARNLSQQRSCQENLTKIDGAKEQWALDNLKSSNDAPGLDELAREDGTGYVKSRPLCPAEGSYTLGTVGVDARCSVSKPLDHNEK